MQEWGSDDRKSVKSYVINPWRKRCALESQARPNFLRIIVVLLLSRSFCHVHAVVSFEDFADSRLLTNAEHELDRLIYIMVKVRISRDRSRSAQRAATCRRGYRYDAWEFGGQYLSKRSSERRITISEFDVLKPPFTTCVGAVPYILTRWNFRCISRDAVGPAWCKKRRKRGREKMMERIASSASSRANAGRPTRGPRRPSSSFASPTILDRRPSLLVDRKTPPGKTRLIKKSRSINADRKRSFRKASGVSSVLCGTNYSEQAVYKILPTQICR